MHAWKAGRGALAERVKNVLDVVTVALCESRAQTAPKLSADIMDFIE